MLLEVKNLAKSFELSGGWLARSRRQIKAVDTVNFAVEAGETLGLVGESGCGKSTTGRLVVRLERPTAGVVLYRGEDIAPLRGSRLKDFRRNVQMIFQDSFSSLNPRLKVAEIIGEALDIHKLAADKAGRRLLIEQAVRDVGLHPEQLTRYPHEFSGGQRQRINIARALCLKPQLIVCDEPISSLDVSIQAQVINILNDIKDKYHLSYLFVSHDLGVVKHLSDRVAVMYLGRIVELASKQDLFVQPRHPYTQALIAAIPNPDPSKKRRQTKLRGEVADSQDHRGCSFAPRCPLGEARCRQSLPELRTLSGHHQVACHLA